MLGTSTCWDDQPKGILCQLHQQSLVFHQDLPSLHQKQSLWQLLQLWGMAPNPTQPPDQEIPYWLRRWVPQQRVLQPPTQEQDWHYLMPYSPWYSQVQWYCREAQLDPHGEGPSDATWQPAALISLGQSSQLCSLHQESNVDLIPEGFNTLRNPYRAQSPTYPTCIHGVLKSGYTIQVVPNLMEGQSWDNGWGSMRRAQLTGSIGQRRDWWQCISKSWFWPIISHSVGCQLRSNHSFLANVV